MISLEEYKNNFIKRYDYEPYLKYFTYNDFKYLSLEEHNIKVGTDTIKGGFYYYDNYNPNQLVVFVHGMGPGHLSYLREIEAIANKGYKVFAYDMIGSGKSSSKAIKGLLGAIESLDWVLDDLKDKYKSISIIGHSLGAFASLNIVKYKPYIKNVVTISGFVSIDLLSSMSNEPSKIIEYERSLNKKYYQNHDDVIASLDKYQGRLMVIHSTDDMVVNPEIGINYLKSNLRKDATYIEVDGKKHNPNYKASAVKYMNDIFSDFNKKASENNWSIDDKKKYFVTVDFKKMTEQDENIWNQIFDFLEK